MFQLFRGATEWSEFLEVHLTTPFPHYHVALQSKLLRQKILGTVKVNNELFCNYAGPYMQFITLQLAYVSRYHPIPHNLPTTHTWTGLNTLYSYESNSHKNR